MKVLEKIKENKIFFVIFGVLVGSSLLYIVDKNFENLMRSYYASLYVVNFGCGFSSRLLIGSIFSLFFKDRLSISTITTILLIIYFVMCFCLSLFVNNRLKKTAYDKTAGTYILFLALCPVFMGFLQYFGTTDVFWIFLVIASFLVVDKKYLRWLVPVFCVVALAIHEFFAVAYLPAIAFAVFYQYAKKPNISGLIYIIFCALLCGAAAVYFLIFSKGTITMTSDEMLKYVLNRIDLQGRGYSDFYVLGTFFWENTDKSLVYEQNLLGYIKYGFDVITNGSLKTILLYIVSNVLSTIPFIYVILKSIKNEKNALKKFSFIIPVLILFISNFLLFMSTDIDRFSQHFLINIIFILLFLIKEKDITFEESYNGLLEKVNSNKAIFAFFGLIIATIILSGVLA